jgi:hypothetical protein
MVDQVKLCECGCGQQAPLAKKTCHRRGYKRGQPVRFMPGHKNGHGQSNSNGGRGTGAYRSWSGARTRCLNPNDEHYAHYGARGIKFLFASFEEFFAELGPRPEGKTLDRIDSNGHYEPGNVRWATPFEQTHNRRPFDSAANFKGNRVRATMHFPPDVDPADIDWSPLPDGHAPPVSRKRRPRRVTRPKQDQQATQGAA